MISEQNSTKLHRRFSSHILMVRPARFAYNAQTAEDNAFMHEVDSLNRSEMQAKAAEEFDMFISTVRKAGIKVTTFDDTPEPHTPDSIFPNNWISFHQNQKIVVYPIKAENRRLEKRPDIVEELSKLYDNPEVIDLSEYEEKGLFLEGTGSLVLDRYHEIAYACLSQRTDVEVLEAFCRLTHYKPVAVHGVDQDGQEIYHTNVMMGLGIGFAAVCLEAVKDKGEREMLRNSLEGTGFEIVPLTYHQMNNFAGNLLQVLAEDGTPYVVLSKRAYDSLTEEQLAVMGRHSKILPVPIDIIEVVGGGSVRCMMAEIFEAPE